MNLYHLTIRILLILALTGASLGQVAVAAPLRQDPPPPIADAGPATILTEAGFLVILNGSGSSGTGLTYEWQQISGLTVTLNTANEVQASFIFPFVLGVAIPVLTFQLTVTDNLGRTSTDTVLVTEERPPAPPALSVLPIPEPPNLATYVRDQQAAIRLGKALFWDMQLGSDGITACASCHYAAGTDIRVTNQVHPGPNGVFDTAGPNGTLQPGNFPLHLIDPVVNQVVRSHDDVIGTQGVLRADFVGLNPGQAVDLDSPLADPVFHANGANTRQVTGRSAPSVINAVFNVRSFWDGRANFVFNGVNPFGNRDANARIWQAQPDGSPAQVTAQIQFASLASQAVGPPNNGVEMAWQGRSFPLLGRKMLGLTPLNGQNIAPTDSVLGPLAGPDGAGLNTGYLQLIQTAFEPAYWDSTQIVVFDELGAPAVADHPGRTLTDSEFSLIEMNFSLFFGLAIQLYEATLVSDQTPFDRYQLGELTALDAQQLRGLDLFVNVTLCTVCHLGPEFTSATVSTLFGPPLPGFPEEPAVAIERMGIASGDLAVYDLGFYNIGVRPSAEDLGVGGDDPFGAPLSFTKLAQQGIPIGPPVPLPPIVSPLEHAAVNGAFKTPSLRNVEVTAPYMHNGGMSTLEQVMDFYARGADFAQQNIADLAPAIVPLPINEQDEADIVAFLKSLTDPRVRIQSAPFDHPQLYLPNGDEFIEFPAIGADGGPALEPFIEINPALTVSQTIAKPAIRLGDATTITATLTNQGDVVLRQVTVTGSHCAFGEPMTDLWSAGALDPGETWTVICTAAPTDDVTSLVAAGGQHKLGQVISADDAQPISVQKPAIAVSIIPTPATVLPGATVTYAYVVTNTGNVPLTGVTLVDDRLGPVTLSSTTLAPDAQATGAATYVAQIADILGTVAHAATATGQLPLGAPVTGGGATLVDVTGPAIQVTVQPQQATGDVGQAIAYDYTVANLGDVELTGVSLTDSRLGPIALGTTTLASGATITGTGSTLVVPGDLPGPVTTLATATGQPPSGPAVSFSAGAAVPVAGSAALTVSQSKPASAQVGTTVQYTFRITNTGPVAYASLTAHDSLLGPIALSGGPLAPGQSRTAVAPLNVVETHLSGPLANTVTVTGVTPAGLPVVAVTGGSLALTSRPALVVGQTVEPASASPGTTVTFTVRVTNTGDVSLQGVTAVGDKLGPITLDTTQLGLHESAVGTATYTVQQNELPGPFANAVIATGTPAYGNGAAVTAQTSTPVTLYNIPAIQVVATANPTAIGLGEAISYTYAITNVGDVDLSDVVLQASRTGVVRFPAVTLTPGAGVTAAASYIPHEFDLPGPVGNTVTASGVTALQQKVSATATTEVALTVIPDIPTEHLLFVPHVATAAVTASLGAIARAAATEIDPAETGPDDPLPVSANATTAGPVSTPGSAALVVTQQPDRVTVQIGESVRVDVTVQNSGDVTLTGLSVVSNRVGPVAMNRADLTPGERAAGTIFYQAKEADLDGVASVIHAAASAQPDGAPVLGTDQAAVVVSAKPGLALTIEAPAAAKIGDAIVLRYVVQNTGNVTLHGVTVADDLGGDVTLPNDSLAPGQTLTGARVWTVSEGDLPGPLVSRATANALPVDGAALHATQQAAVAVSGAGALAVSVAAAVDAAAVGDAVEVRYTVKNTGNLALNNVTVDDSRLGPVALNRTRLEPGASAEGVILTPVTQDDLAGAWVHAVKARGVDRMGREVETVAGNTLAVSGGTLVVKFVEEGGGAPPVVLTVNGAAYAVAGGDEKRLDALPTGRYEVSQTLPPAWTAVAARCDAQDWITQTPDTVSLNLRRGETAVCTFTVAALSTDNEFYLPAIRR